MPDRPLNGRQADDAGTALGVVTSWRSRNEHRDARVGQKAHGLLDLPEAWTPPFVAWLREADSEVEDVLFGALVELVSRADGARLIVRSDGPAEATHPGGGTSVVVLADTEALAQALRDRAVARCALVQVAVEPAVVGLMSNERRLSADTHAWMLEGELSLARPELRPLPVPAPTRPDLQAVTPHDALDALGAVAAQLAADGGRRRVEWVWDGSRVWIVQADRLPERAPAAHPPGPTGGPTPLRGPLTGDTSFVGTKIERWRVFERLGWARPRTLVITGDRWRRDALLVARQIHRAMSAEASGPWVARTDILEHLGAAGLLLTTSPAADDPARLLGFMEDTAKRMAAGGVTDEHWAFLAAPLYPCQASAWAHASPDADLVTVDALWGFPDGLLHLPHDSYEINPTGDVSAHVRFKPACVVPENEEWATQKLPAPYDWETPLDDDELRAIAALARALAIEVDQAVNFMILARVRGLRGASGLLPFHYTLVADRRRPIQRLPSEDGDEVVLAGPADLDALDKRQRPAALRVEPEPQALRDATFLRSVGRWASEHRVPIIFTGSALGHAFHLLAQDGAAVVQPALDDTRQQLDDAEWQPVVVAYAQGLERLRVVPRHVVRTAAAAMLARIGPGVTTDARAVRALAALLDQQPAGGNTGLPFDTLGRVEVEQTLGGATAGAVPLFMDEGSSGRPADTLVESSFELPIGDGEVSPLHVDVPGGYVSVSSSKPGEVHVTVTPTPGI